MLLRSRNAGVEQHTPARCLAQTEGRAASSDDYGGACGSRVEPPPHLRSRRLRLRARAVGLPGRGRNEVREGVDQAQETARDAQRLRDAVRDFDRAAAERKVREVVQQPIRDLSCPLEPTINWDLAAVEIRCTAVLGSGDELVVPVRYTPGVGLSAGQPRQVN